MQITNNKETILKYAIIVFFLNRLFILEISNYYPILDEIYVLISEIITIWYCFKFLYKHNRNKYQYVKEVGIVLLVTIYSVHALLRTLFNDGSARRVVMTAYLKIRLLCFVEVETDNHYDEMIRVFNLMEAKQWYILA